MINKAKRFGFDFDKHYNNRFGILRTFVKQHKPTMAKGKGKDKAKYGLLSSQSKKIRKDYSLN